MTEGCSLQLPIENDATIVLYVPVTYDLPAFPFLRRIRPFMQTKLRVYPSSDQSGSTSDQIGRDLLTLTETQTLLRGSGYNKCTIKTSAAASKLLVTKCGKCLCSGIKRRIGEVRVKSDREGKSGGILKLKQMNDGRGG